MCGTDLRRSPQWRHCSQDDCRGRSFSCQLPASHDLLPWSSLSSPAKKGCWSVKFSSVNHTLEMYQKSRPEWTRVNNKYLKQMRVVVKSTFVDTFKWTILSTKTRKLCAQITILKCPAFQLPFNDINCVYVLKLHTEQLQFELIHTSWCPFGWSSVQFVHCTI